MCIHDDKVSQGSEIGCKRMSHLLCRREGENATERRKIFLLPHLRAIKGGKSGLVPLDIHQTNKKTLSRKFLVSDKRMLILTKSLFLAKFLLANPTPSNSGPIHREYKRSGGERAKSGWESAQGQKKFSSWSMGEGREKKTAFFLLYEGVKWKIKKEQENCSVRWRKEIFFVLGSFFRIREGMVSPDIKILFSYLSNALRLAGRERERVSSRYALAVLPPFLWCCTRQKNDSSPFLLLYLRN